jgi:hypothetical protein
MAKKRVKTEDAALAPSKWSLLDRLPMRYMTVVAQDPSVRWKSGRILTARIAVPGEILARGPMGHRVQVVDYDASTSKFYGSHDLPARYEDEPEEWQKGDPSIVDDFGFHAQNTYALVMKTLARFEFALGRRISWSFDTHQLKVAPHGMQDANAFYSPDQEALVFGYFDSAKETVYTSLSHDVVVHETTHALLDALRERYLLPTDADQAAFHEALGDVVALLSVFTQPEVVSYLLLGSDQRIQSGERLLAKAQCTPAALKESALFGLAKQMGSALQTARGEALRKSAEIEPNAKLLDTPEFAEPHRRGEIFVAAVLHAFIEAWADRIVKSGVKGQRKYPLLHVVEQGADIADALVTLWIRAIDYMPPVHLTFADALTAALTSDTRVRPDDSRYELRRHLTTAFAAFGIQPVATAVNGCWGRAPEDLNYDRVRFESLRSDKDEVFRFLWENREALEICSEAYTRVLSVRPCVRVGVDGFVVRETVAEYYQVARMTAEELAQRKIKAPRDLVNHLKDLAAEKQKRKKANNGAENGGPENDDQIMPPIYGGGVLIFDEYGRLLYHIHNDVFGSNQGARLEYLWNAGLLRLNAGNPGYRAARLSTLHRLRAMDARKWPTEGW